MDILLRLSTTEHKKAILLEECIQVAFQRCRHHHTRTTGPRQKQSRTGNSWQKTTTLLCLTYHQCWTKVLSGMREATPKITVITASTLGSSKSKEYCKNQPWQVKASRCKTRWHSSTKDKLIPSSSSKLRVQASRTQAGCWTSQASVRAKITIKSASKEGTLLPCRISIAIVWTVLLRRS